MMLPAFFTRYKLHHLPFWLLLGGVWYYLRYQDYTTTGQALAVTLVKVLDLMLLVYLVNYFFIPRLLYRKQYLLFALVVVVAILISSGIKMYVIGHLLNNPALYQWTSAVKSRIYDNVIPHFFLVIAGMAAKLLADHNRMQNRLLQIGKEKAETELNFLKSQINPHFLFNALNAVYFLIDKQNTEARKALHTFSDMLRYQLYEVKDEKVPIEKEVAYLQDYMGLQRLRHENCAVEMKVEESATGFLVEPLLLLPFVENAFKHLSRFTNGRKNEIKILLTCEADGLSFSIKNTTEPRGTLIEPGGIGLQNVKRRLELLYPASHRLSTTEENGWYLVKLNLKT